MKIIPVIDYMNGHVVLAEKGNRSNYLPVNSKLCKHSDVHSVMEKILSLANFNTIYIADLNSINQQKLNIDVWQSIFLSYPEIEFWCDIGVQVNSWGAFIGESVNVRPVIGSESFANLDELGAALKLAQNANPILSLDFKNKSVIGPSALLNNFSDWPNEIIALSLDRVGNLHGPDIELLHMLKNKLEHCKIYAGGGVRNSEDLQQLKLLGISGALIAKSLHTYAINRNELQLFIN